MTLPSTEDSFISTGQVTLHVIQAGPKNGRPVILLHGFPDFWFGWDKQIGPLADAGLRVIAPDQRGYNLSDKPKGLSAYRLDLLAQDVVGLMDALDFTKVTIVGHDWGGMVAWVTAALYPHRVERLAVLDAPYLPVVFHSLLAHPRQLLKSSYMYFFQLPFLPEAVLGRNHWEPLVENIRRTSPPDAFTDQDFDRYRQAWDQKGAFTAMLNWYRALFRRPARLPANPRFEMPTLILWGEKDFALGLELAEASLALCAHGKLVVLSGANHWIPRSDPERVNPLLLSFCDGSSDGSQYRNDGLTAPADRQ